MQFFVCVIMDVARVAIVAYLLKRTPNPLPNVGGVDAMVTVLAFGHICELQSGLMKMLEKTLGISNDCDCVYLDFKIGVQGSLTSAMNVPAS
jgi:hypothetical protein